MHFIQYVDYPRRRPQFTVSESSISLPLVHVPFNIWTTSSEPGQIMASFSNFIIFFSGSLKLPVPARDKVERGRDSSLCCLSPKISYMSLQKWKSDTVISLTRGYDHDLAWRSEGGVHKRNWAESWWQNRVGQGVYISSRKIKKEF